MCSPIRFTRPGADTNPVSPPAPKASTSGARGSKRLSIPLTCYYSSHDPPHESQPSRLCSARPGLHRLFRLLDCRCRLILQDQRVFFQPLLRAEKGQREKEQKIMLSPHGMLDARYLK